MHPDEPRTLGFDTPSVYRIVVQGRIREPFCDRLAGMHISYIDTDNQGLATVLLGRLLDQAQLRGVLETLYGLHLPIVAVEAVDEVHYREKC